MEVGVTIGISIRLIFYTGQGLIGQPHDEEEEEEEEKSFRCMEGRLIIYN